MELPQGARRDGMCDAFNRLMASADPALIVVTTAIAGERAGCLVGFHSQSSITGRQYSFWLSKANHTYRVSLRAQYFGIHFLTAGDLEIARQFGARSGEEVDKYAGIAVDADASGVPLLRECPHRLLVERIAMLDDGGDHVALTTHVRAAHSPGDFTPLRLSDANGLEAGRSSQERVIEPWGTDPRRLRRPR